MRLTEPTRQLILLVAGLTGLAIYALVPHLRDPILLPIYAGMVGLRWAYRRDRQTQSTDESLAEKVIDVIADPPHYELPELPSDTKESP